METKEAIISTISELNSKMTQEANNETRAQNNQQNNTNKEQKAATNDIDFLLDLQEKTLVLFEGLRNSSLVTEKKLNMVINYLEYQLSVIEDKINTTHYN